MRTRRAELRGRVRILPPRARHARARLRRRVVHARVGALLVHVDREPALCEEDGHARARGAAADYGD